MQSVVFNYCKAFPRSFKRSLTKSSAVHTMALKLSIEQNIRCEDVVKIAEQAAEVMLAIYNSKVRN